jgi:hypothetical protein
MAHYRKLIVDDQEHKYKVGRHATYIRDLGTFSHQGWAFNHDSSMDGYTVTPRDVEYMIRKTLGTLPANFVRTYGYDTQGTYGEDPKVKEERQKARLRELVAGAAAEVAKDQGPRKRGFGKLCGKNIFSVDTEAINAVMLETDEGERFTIEAESGPLGIPVIKLTRYEG